MANISGLNYTNIENPYDGNLNRVSTEQNLFAPTFTESSQSPAPDTGTQKITGNSLENLWINSWIKSRNYKPKTQGFLFDGALGYIECMKLYVGQGGIVGGSLDIPDTSTANSFHVDASGNTWWGAILIADATAKVLNTGAGTFSNLTVTGGTIGGSLVASVGYVATTAADAIPTGLAYSTGGISTGSDGSQSSYAVLTWDVIATNTFDHYLIRYKKASLTYYTYIPANINTITIEGLTPNISYNFGVASVNKYGTVSAFSADIAQTTASDSTAPATVTSGSATAGIQYVILEWTHNTDSDLASYNIYRNTANDSATSTLIGNSRTNYFVDGGRTGGQIYYYWVKAIDTSGNVSASFSAVKSATPRNVESTDVTSIAAAKILIDGVVYLSNWQKGTDLTKIDGGQISANTVTTTQLNFTPVQTGNVIASINASVEGITIEADNLTISSATTFVAGYDPTSKTAKVGGTYDSAASGARVRIFPDANTGIQIIDDAAADVFKAIVGGTDVGDVIIGNYTGGQGIKYDKSAGTTTFQGSITSSIITGGTIQTAAAYQRIVLTSTGLAGYNSAGTQELWLNASAAETLNGLALISATDQTLGYFDNTATGALTKETLIAVNRGTGKPAAFFKTYNTGATGDTVQIIQSGAGNGLYINLTLSTNAAYAGDFRNAGTSGGALYCFTGANSTGAVAKFEQTATVSTNFKRILNLDGMIIFKSDGTSPNGVLSGAAGNICINADAGKAYYCTGTTNWTAF